MRVPPPSSALLPEGARSDASADRRRHPRFPVSGKVLVFHSDEEAPFFAWLANISCGGACIRTHRLLPEGTEIRLVFGAQGGYDLQATIVRTADPLRAPDSELGFAVRFARELPPGPAR